MLDLTTYRLNHRQVATFASLGIGLFRDYKTGAVHVSRGYWEGIDANIKKALGIIAKAEEGTSDE